MEMLYQYLWKHGMVGRKAASGRARELTAVDGRTVTVEYPGVLNRDSGPDFTGARIRLGDEQWAGNVEIHEKASDWFRHGHQNDSAYSNVILHVVGVSDAEIPDSRGGHIPQVVITYPESFARLYMRLSEKISEVRCESLLSGLPDLAVTDWTASLYVERMQRKALHIDDVRRQVGGDWERACFIALARALGFGLNADPFEMTARSIPLTTLLHHSDDEFQLEALLFGQAGMLDTSVHIFDEYYQRLCREYFFLVRKYGLRPMRRDIWKYARTRPQNFPHRRVALLAQALKDGFSLMSQIIDRSSDPDDVRALFVWRLPEYWAKHFDFDTDSTPNPEALSKGSVDLLMINFAAPLIYAYGMSRGNPDIAERGLAIWESLPPENNVIVRQWRHAGIPCSNAADSQALLQLRKEYCDRNRCLDCRFGHLLLRKTSEKLAVES